MPPKLYAEDPRVKRASALLKSLETGLSPSRTPNAASRPPSFDIIGMTLQRPVEQHQSGISFLTDLPWDVVAAMNAELATTDLFPLDPSDALNYIARDWLTGHGHPGLLQDAEAAD